MQWMICRAFIMASLAVLFSVAAIAQVQEWPLLDGGLRERTTLALQRYFSVVRPDSLRLRYLNSNAASLIYRIRGRRTAEDTLGQLFSIGLGQLMIHSSTNLRIALGDDLYTELALSRNDPNVLSELREISSTIGLDRLDAEYSVMLALDRLDYRFNHDLGAFVGAGAPESNLFWWSDGTLRLGLEGVNWEFALLLPYGAGSTEFGFLHERLLAPAYGAAVQGELGHLAGRLRFAIPGDPAFISPTAATRRIVHTAGGALTWRGTLDTRYGMIHYGGGIGYEEFTATSRDTSQEAVPAGRVRRLSPVIDIQWRAPGDNVSISLGVVDIALRAALSARLTDRLALDFYYVANNVFRDVKPFEHTSVFFLTPRLFF
jgi:hypothetical protein